MKKILTLCICFIALQLLGQTPSQEDLVGTWKVKTATVTVGENTPAQQQIRNEIKQGLTNAEFEFGPQQGFRFRMPASRPASLAEMESISGSSWKWDAALEMVMIGSELDGYNLLHLKVVRKDNAVTFNLPGIALSMKKI
ncbi:MAG: hypothetical protein CL867_05890 [Cytophagaceae bacterium]|nr:hypothetical protein [Cytophagaceae bacterium]